MMYLHSVSDTQWLHQKRKNLLAMDEMGCKFEFPYLSGFLDLFEVSVVLDYY